MSSAASGLNRFAAFGEEVMRSRNTLKWRTYPPDVLPLWIAEMDTDPAPEIVDAVERSLRNGETGYPSGSALRDAFGDFALRRWGWAAPVAAMVEVADLITGLSVALDLVTGPGDPVIITPPVWPPFAQLLAHRDRRVVPAPLGADGRLDFATLEEALDRSTWHGGRTALLLCSPHNPTGVVHSRDELGRLAELSDRYRVRVVVDEIHAPLCHPGHRFVPYLSVPGTGSGLVVVSAAKAWNIAGLKAALLVPGPEALTDGVPVPELVRYGASGIGMVAHAAAYAEGGPWLDAHLASLAENRALVGELVARLLPEVGFRPPAATYFAWLDCRALALEPDPATAFLDRGRVALSGGETFGAGGEGWARLNFAAAPGTVEEAVERMSTVGSD